jgi:hypothetical protein
VGPDTDFDELYSSIQAKLALANLIEVMGLVEMLIDNASPEKLHELALGWAERCDFVRDWCTQQAKEMVIFGQAFDTGTPFGTEDPR